MCRYTSYTKVGKRVEVMLSDRTAAGNLGFFFQLSFA